MLEKRTREFQRRSRRLHKLSAAYSYAHLFVGGECRELDGAAAEEWASDEEAASPRGSGSLSPLSASASQRLGGLSPVAPNANADAEQHDAAALLSSPVVCEHNVSTWGAGAPASNEDQLLLKRLPPNPDADAAGGSTQCAQSLEDLELTHADKDAFVVHVRPRLTCALCLPANQRSHRSPLRLPLYSSTRAASSCSRVHSRTASCRRASGPVISSTRCRPPRCSPGRSGDRAFHRTPAPGTPTTRLPAIPTAHCSSRRQRRPLCDPFFVTSSRKTSQYSLFLYFYHSAILICLHTTYSILH